MSHTSRYYELKKLSILLGEASKIAERMAFNEDLPIFDAELEKSLKSSYHNLNQRISELKNELSL